MFTANSNGLRDIIKYITIIFSILFPIMGLIPQILFKPLSWLSWFRLVFIWNSIYWLIVAFPNITRIGQFYIDYSEKGRMMIYSIFIILTIISIILINIEPKLKLPKIIKIK